MKNTRLIYTDEEHLKMYEAIPDKQFKEFILAIVRYNYGDDDFANTIEDPMVKALFLAEKPRIDFNEKKWQGRAKANAENGKKGGRPKKKEQVKGEEPQVEDYTPKEEQVDDKLQTELKEVYNMYSNGNKMYELRLNRMKDKYGIPYLRLKEMMDEVWETT